MATDIDIIMSAWVHITIDRHGLKMRELGDEARADAAWAWAPGQPIVREDLTKELEWYIVNSGYTVPPIPPHCLTADAIDFVKQVVKFYDSDDSAWGGWFDDVSFYLGKWADNKITDSVKAELEADITRARGR